MITTKRLMTLEEYLDYDDGTDTRYELVNGELRQVPTESDINVLIAVALLVQFSRFLPPTRLRHKTEIAVSGYRVTTRIPDLTVLSEELAQALAQAKRSVVMPDMPPPELVVEVVSPGRENQERDYRYKRSEYAARGIQEYWIIDPQQARVTVLTLVSGMYEEAVFAGDHVIASLVLPELDLTATQVLQPE
ncbi:MAG: Uma2 family endonuclease [Cyanophyceae cyanobacterium]